MGRDNEQRCAETTSRAKKYNKRENLTKWGRDKKEKMRREKKRAQYAGWWSRNVKESNPVAVVWGRRHREHHTKTAWGSDNQKRKTADEIIGVPSNTGRAQKDLVLRFWN